MISKKMLLIQIFKNRRNKLELIRYVWEEISQRKSQNSVCRLFGYVNSVYEAQFRILSKADKLNWSPSAYEILLQENMKLTKSLEKERERRHRAEEGHKSELEQINKHHSTVIEDMKEKIDSLKPKIKNKNKETSESESSDIFEGLNESKKEQIMAEVAELYEANIALQIENTMLKK